MQMSSKVYRQWRHLISQVLMIGLVFQAVMVAYMLPMPVMAAMGVTSGWVSASDSRQMIICTPSGLKQITVDDNGNFVEVDVTGNNHCSVCDTLAGTTFALNEMQPALPARFVSPENCHPVNDHRLPSITCRVHNNRDPPFPV